MDNTTVRHFQLYCITWIQNHLWRWICENPNTRMIYFCYRSFQWLTFRRRRRRRNKNESLTDVRVAALEALVEVVRADARIDDWEFIIDIIEKDPEPRVRHKLLLLLAKNPPFEKGRGSRLDTIEIADRFWRLMK